MLMPNVPFFSFLFFWSLSFLDSTKTMPAPPPPRTLHQLPEVPLRPCHHELQTNPVRGLLWRRQPLRLPRELRAGLRPLVPPLNEDAFVNDALASRGLSREDVIYDVTSGELRRREVFDVARSASGFGLSVVGGRESPWGLEIVESRRSCERCASLLLPAACCSREARV